MTSGYPRGAVSEVVANAVVVVGGGGDGGGLEKGGNMRVTVVEATSYATGALRRGAAEIQRLCVGASGQVAA